MSRRPPAWSRILAALALVLSAGLTAAPAAVAHPGHPEHEAAEIPASDYQQVQLALGGSELGEAMSLAVLPDRSVVHTARDGTVRLTDAAGNTKTSGKLDVYTHDEEGLQESRPTRTSRPTGICTSTTRPSSTHRAATPR